MPTFDKDTFLAKLTQPIQSPGATGVADPLAETDIPTPKDPGVDPALSQINPDGTLFLGKTESSEPVSAEGAPDVPSDETGFLDASRAFFKTENFIFTSTRELFAPAIDHTVDPDFTPIDKLEKERPDLLPFVSNFAHVNNQQEYDREIFNIEFENDARETFAKAPTLTKLAAGIAASVVDPLILIPYVGTLGAVARGARVAKGLATGAVLGAASGTAREGLLHLTSSTRTLEESKYNIIAETLFASVLGGVAGALANPVKQAGNQILAKALAGTEYKINVSKQGKVTVAREDSAGAKRYTIKEELGLAHINETLAKTIAGPEFLRAPDLRAILSPSGSVRQLGEVFYNSNYIRHKHVDGIASGERAQNAIFRSEQKVILRLKEVEDLYLDYTGSGTLRNIISRPKGKIKSREFADRIWKNLTDSTRVDEIAQVNKASKMMRKEMDARAAELQAAGILEEGIDPKFMANYMSRVYNTKKLLSRVEQADFVKVVSRWVKRHKSDASVRKTPLSDEKADQVASDILDNIRGEGDHQISLAGMTESLIPDAGGKFTKHRKFLIPDSEIAPWLKTDANALFKSYMSRTAKMLETKKAMERANMNSFEDVIRNIKAEADAASVGLVGKAAEKVGERFAKEEKLASMMYRSMLGQLRKPGASDRYAEALLNYQFVRLLGGVTVSSLPELAMTPFRQGILKTLRHAYLPMIRDFKAAKLSKNQLNDLTGALEFEQANILRSLGGIDDMDNIGRNQTNWDIFSEMMTSSFVKVSGVGHFTSGNRRVAAQVSVADIIRTLQKGPKGKDIQRLAALGIGIDDYPKILAQINKHTQVNKGSYVMNPHLWDDDGALSLMKNAVQNEIESAVLKPGVEATPFFVQQHIWAKVLFQFKSFMSAATGKITISGIQRRDANVLSGIMALIAMGALTDMAQDKLANREVEEDPARLLVNAISRSGMLGLYMTTILDIGNTFANEKTRRFGGKFVSSNVIGPSAGQIEELVRATAGITDGDVSEKDVKSMMRMIPFMNLFYIKALTSRALDS